MQVRFTNFLIALLVSLTHFLKSLKICSIVGTKYAMFGMHSCIFPLVGTFFGIRGSILSYLARAIIMFTIQGSFLISCLNPLPSLGSALYLSNQSKLLRITLPLVAIILYNIHPIGNQFPLYSLYWIIPIVAAFIPIRLFYFQALGATFTAHSIGTIMWLYTKSLSLSSLHALAHIVWAERLLFAACITVAYYSIYSLESVIKKKKRNYALST